MTGRLLSLMMRAIVSMSFCLNFGWGANGIGFSYSIVAAVTSFVMSTRTGPFRPSLAIRNALRKASAKSSIRLTK